MVALKGGCGLRRLRDTEVIINGAGRLQKGPPGKVGLGFIAWIVITVRPVKEKFWASGIHIEGKKKHCTRKAEPRLAWHLSWLADWDKNPVRRL